MGYAAEEGGGEESTTADALSFGRRDMVEAFRTRGVVLQGGRMTVQFFLFREAGSGVNVVLSDTSYAALGGLYLETAVFWRYSLPHEVQVKGRLGVGKRRGLGYPSLRWSSWRWL